MTKTDEARARKKAANEKYRTKHREKIALQRVGYYQQNKGLFAANKAKRRAAIRSQTTTTADRIAIRAIYEMAERMTRITGVSYNVDHIKPLSKGGLHHQDNLVVMRADWNNRKYADEWSWLYWFLEA